MIHPARLATLCLLALGLAACGEKAATDKDAAAGGQVLPGSTSDAMLPQDTISSQPPLAKSADEGDAQGGDAAKDAGDKAKQAGAGE